MKINNNISLKYCLRALDTTTGRSRFLIVVFFCPVAFLLEVYYDFSFKKQ
jgi:hypothetical protein